jgi:dipeptidyl aminopeptidase/acylaminoacyl peptidase
MPRSHFSQSETTASKSVALLSFAASVVFLGACSATDNSKNAPSSSQAEVKPLPSGPVTPQVAVEWNSLGDRAAALASRIAPTWSKDSKQVILSVADQAHPGKSSVESIDVASGNRTRLGEGLEPKVSPDGRSILYLAGDGPNRQLWVMDFNGQNQRQLTHHTGGLNGGYFSSGWSPDSKQIAFAYKLELTAEKAERRKNTVRSASSVVVYGTERDLPTPGVIVTVDVASGNEKNLATMQGDLSALSWMPDGQNLLFYINRIGTFYREVGDISEVRSISVVDGKTRTLASGGGEQMYASPSPDGKQIGFYYDSELVRYPDMYEVSLVSANGGAITSLTKTPKIFVDDYLGPVWAPDGSGMYYSTKDGAFSQIFFVTTKGEKKRITSSAADHRTISLSPDGQHLAYYEDDAQGNKRFVVAQSDGQNEKSLLDFTPAFKNLTLGKGREVRWKSKDGVEIAGILIEPPNYTPEKRYPLMVGIHGGPVGGTSITCDALCIGPLEAHMWAAKGYLFLSPDYRSSGVYGWDKIMAGRKNQDFMAKDFDDIMGGVDYLIKEGMVDPDRMVVGGHSYGSVMTNWIITHTNRFKAAITYEGASDFYLLYGSEYGVGGNTSLEWSFNGKPWETPDHYFKNSCLYMMKGVRTPTLFIVGDGTEYGGSYPAEFEFMYSALKQQHVDTQMLLYKQEGHVVMRPENVRDLTERSVKWVDDHINGTHAKAASIN